MARNDGMKSERTSRGVGFLVLISLVIMVLSNVFQLAAVASNHWVDTVSEDFGTIGYSGLWQTCTNYGLTSHSCRGFQWTDVQVSHWFRTVQALEVIGFMLGVTALFMMALHHFVETCFTNRYLKPISMLMLVFSFLFVLSGGCVIGALKDVQKAININSEAYMSWSFGFSIVAAILYLASTIAIAIA